MYSEDSSYFQQQKTKDYLHWYIRTKLTGLFKGQIQDQMRMQRNFENYKVLYKPLINWTHET